MGELARVSYLLRLTFDEPNDELGVLGGIAEDACDLVEGHWRVKADVVDVDVLHRVAEAMYDADREAHQRLVSRGYVPVPWPQQGQGEQNRWFTRARAALDG